MNTLKLFSAKCFIILFIKVHTKMYFLSFPDFFNTNFLNLSIKIFFFCIGRHLNICNTRKIFLMKIQKQGFQTHTKKLQKATPECFTEYTLRCIRPPQSQSGLMIFYWRTFLSPDWLCGGLIHLNVYSVKHSGGCMMQVCDSLEKEEY